MHTVILPCGTRLVSTPILPGSSLVRVHPDDGPHYNAMPVASPGDGNLHLSGWLGPTLTCAQFLAARDALYPEANRILFERMRVDGSLSSRELRLA
jgi:hypothetical protein